MTDNENRLRATLAAEAERVTVSPQMRRRIDARLRRGAPVRVLALSAAVALVAIGAVVWSVVGGRTVRQDVIAPPTREPEPTPSAVGPAYYASQEAVVCFVDARRRRDLAAAEPCMTPRYRSSITDPVQFIGTSSPALERATIVSSSHETDSAVFDVLMYWGRVEFVSEDTIVVVREGDRWLVDRWTQGTLGPVAATTEVTLYFANIGDTPMCDGSKVLTQWFVPITRSVPTEVVVDDLALSVVRELFTGPWPHEGDASVAFPYGTRTHGVSVDASGVATVTVREVDGQIVPECDYRGEALRRTLAGLEGINDARTQQEDEGPSPEPDV